MDLFLRFLHIAVAAAWFGHKLLVPGDIKAALASGQGESNDLVPRLNRAERLGQLTGVGTVLTGLLLAWFVGFDTVAATTYFGLGLVVLAILIGATIARPASNALRSAISNEDRAGAALAGRQIRRVLAIEGLLWSATLVTMLV